MMVNTRAGDGDMHAGGGDVGFASQSDHTDDQIARGCHDLGRRAGAHLGPVFIGGPVHQKPATSYISAIMGSVSR